MHGHAICVAMALMAVAIAIVWSRERRDLPRPVNLVDAQTPDRRQWLARLQRRKDAPWRY
jgi:hypothetical protein